MNMNHREQKKEVDRAISKSNKETAKFIQEEGSKSMLDSLPQRPLR
jgi:hypothetical protein